MKPLRLEFKNYKSYGDNEIILDFKEDTSTLIMGENGAGKSTFFDAMIWCIYGKTYGSADSVVNRKTKKNCKVEFDFSVDNDEYSINRYRNHDEYGNNIFIFKNKSNITPTKKNMAQKMIDEEIIGINYDSMVSSVIFSEELYEPILSLTNSRRLKVFEGVLSLKRMNKWVDSLKKERKPLLEKIRASEDTVMRLETTINETENNIKSYSSSAKNKILELKKEKEELEEKIKKLEGKIGRYNDVDINVELEKNRKHSEAKEHNKKIKEQIGQIKKIDLDEILLKISTLKEEIERLSKIDVKKELEVISLNEKKTKKNSEIDLKISNLKNELKPVEELQKNIIELNKETKKSEEYISELSKEVCPYCGTSLSKNKQTLNEKLELEKEKEDFNKNRKEELENQIKEINKNNEKIDEGIKELEDSYEILEKEKLSKEELNNISEKINNDKNELKIKEAEYETSFKQKEENEKRILELENQLREDVNPSEFSNKELESINDLNEEIKEKIKKHEKRLDAIKVEAVSVYDKEYINNLKDKKKNVEAKLKKEKSNMEELLYEDEHYKYLINKLSNKDSGIKKEIISGMIDVFNEKINYYTNFFFERKVDVYFDKSLDVAVFEDDAEIDVSTFSSGEKKRLDLAISFSLFMLVKTYFSNDNNFIVFDEILDNNLDEKGINNVIQIITSLSKNNSVYIISHKEDFKDYFNNKINIVKDENGFSKIA